VLVLSQGAECFSELIYDRDDAIYRANEFAAKGMPDKDLKIESMSHLPIGTIIACVHSIEFVPNGTVADPPILFNEPSIIIS